MDFIGWYTTGDAPNITDIKIHKQICEINESPIMLKLNPYDKNIEVTIVNLHLLYLRQELYIPSNYVSLTFLLKWNV